MRNFSKIFLFCLVSCLLIAPLAVSAAGLVPDCPGDGPCHFKDLIRPGGLIDNVMKFLIFGIAVPGATLVILIAGVKMVMNPGNAQARGAAKRALGDAVIGLFVALAAYIIVKTIISFTASGTEAGKAIKNILK